VGLEVIKGLGYLGGPRKKTGVNFLRDLCVREVVTLSIQRVDDFAEAHEIAD
jgi:hypothetical protein